MLRGKYLYITCEVVSMRSLLKSKSGVEMSLNVIIIAAIAVLILVILIMFVFKGQSGVSSSTACEGGAIEGVCEYESCTGLNGYVRYPIGDLSCKEANTGTICCAKLN